MIWHKYIHQKGKEYAIYYCEFLGGKHDFQKFISLNMNKRLVDLNSGSAILYPLSYTMNRMLQIISKTF